MSEHQTSSQDANVAVENDDRAMHGSATATAEHSETGELFDKEELARFDAEDVQAGRAIGKMLGLFFLYTVFAMSLVAWWTWTTLVR